MGRRALVSPELAARAALALIDDQGLDALSLEAVAGQLGVTAPSLYRHVANRADLLRHVARLILVETRIGRPAAENWRDHVIEVCVETRRAILAHPHAAPLLLRFLPHQILLPGYEVRAKLLLDNAVPPDVVLPMIRGLEALTFGAALFDATAVSDRQPPFPGPVTGHPHLERALAANSQDPERLFRTIVSAFIDGFGPV